jgi:hypothetical protein
MQNAGAHGRPRRTTPVALDSLGAPTERCRAKLLRDDRKFDFSSEPVCAHRALLCPSTLRVEFFKSDHPLNPVLEGR